MNREPGDRRPRGLRPDGIPPPVPLEPGDIQRRTVIGGGPPEVDVKRDTGDVEVKFTNQIHNDNRYLGDRAHAEGAPHFIPRRPHVRDNYVLYRIRGERPMRLVILKNGATTYSAIVNTGKSCMWIKYRSQASNFIVRLTNKHDGVQTRFPPQ